MLIFDDQLWSNNNAESMNSSIRKATKFEQLELEVLINHLRILVERQILMEKSALHSLGDYKITGIHRRYLISNSK